MDSTSKQVVKAQQLAQERLLKSQQSLGLMSIKPKAASHIILDNHNSEATHSSSTSLKILSTLRTSSNNKISTALRLLINRILTKGKWQVLPTRPIKRIRISCATV